MKIKRTLETVFALLMLAISVISLASCEIVMSFIPGKSPGTHIHELSEVAEKPATCTEPGVKAYYTCSGCEKMFADSKGENEITSPEVIGVTDHSFTDYKSNNDATCLKDGTKTAKCDNCELTETITDVGSKKVLPLAEEEFLNQVACYGTTNTPNGDGALKRGRIIITIPMLAGTKVTFVGDLSVYKFSVIRTNNPTNPTEGGNTYQIDPGWNTTWQDQSCFILPEPDGGRAPEYIVIVFTRIDGAKLSEIEIQNLHNLVTVEGNKAIETSYEGRLTKEEYNRQAGHYGSVTSTYNNSNKRIRISFDIRMEIGTVVKFVGDTTLYKWAVVETADTSITTKILDSGWNNSWSDPSASYVSKINGGFLVLTVSKLDNSAMGVDDMALVHSMFEVEGNKFNENGNPKEAVEYEVNSINHRGYSKLAPENTLIAYRYAYLSGFRFVECDISFTKDGYAVLLHDDSIDRTSNGSGNIADLTLDEARAYDYGSWKDMSFKGEAIPTFEEFIALCAELGLHPYIEIKSSITAEQAKALVDIAAKYDLPYGCSWISFQASSLKEIIKHDDTARIGYVCNSVTESVITTCLEMNTDKNEVFIDVKYSAANANAVSLCKNAEIPLEVWTVNSEADALALDPYVSGVSSDYIIAGELLCSSDE